MLETDLACCVLKGFDFLWNVLLQLVFFVLHLCRKNTGDVLAKTHLPINSL